MVDNKQTTQTTSSVFLQGGNAISANLILGSLDSNALTFMSSSTERARITAAGAFLLGTTTPTLTAGNAAWMTIVGSSTFPTADLFKVSSTSGLALFDVGYDGNLRIGTSTVNGTINVQTISTLSGYI